MSNRRSKLEITLDVLKAVRDGVEKPTRIMYVTNMSWNPTQELLKRLVTEGYLEVTENRTEKRSKKRYLITEKGLNVINYLRGAEALINI